MSFHITILKESWYSAKSITIAFATIIYLVCVVLQIHFVSLIYVFSAFYSSRIDVRALIDLDEDKHEELDADASDTEEEVVEECNIDANTEEEALEEEATSNIAKPVTENEDFYIAKEGEKSLAW